MDSNPAEEAQSLSNAERILAAVSSQAATMERHEQVLAQQESAVSRLGQAISEILQHLQGLSNPRQNVEPQLQIPPSAPSTTSSHPEVHLPHPERYDGSPGGCRGFLTQCSLSFELQPSKFPTSRSKVAYVITLLSGRALAWATALWEKSPQPAVCSDYSCFIEEMRRVFEHPVSGREAASRLLQLTQGTRSVAELAVEFRTLALESGWNQEALTVAFNRALSEELKDELASRDPASDLESLIDMAIRLDNRLRERRRERTESSRFVPSQHSLTLPLPHDQSASFVSGTEEPMQLARSRLSQSERERRMKDKCCLYCGEPGHFRAFCPILSGKANSRPVKGGLR